MFFIGEMISAVSAGLGYYGQKMWLLKIRGKMTFLTIDIGSSSVRAILFDRDAKLIEGAAASRKYNFDVTAEGGSTVDADLVKDLVEQCIDEVGGVVR